MIFVAILIFLQSLIMYISLKYAVFTKFELRRVTHRSLNKPRSGLTRRGLIVAQSLTVVFGVLTVSTR